MHGMDDEILGAAPGEVAYRLRRWWWEAPCQRVYPMVGGLLALGAPMGLALVHAISVRAFPTPAWVVGDIAKLPATYAYVTLATMTALGVLGYIVGLWSDHLHRLSITDPLTGLFNRRVLETRAAQEVERSRRYGIPLSLLVMDLDGLKAINDTCGHKAGDDALRAVACSLLNNVRTSDVAARVGGDEFAVLLPETFTAEALAAGSRIAGAIAGRAAGLGMPLSVSVGVSELVGAHPRSLDELLKVADGALYEAKAAGGGRVLAAAGALRRMRNSTGVATVAVGRDRAA